jgi:TfoX/Sxy family transcriptional regulator of competence genes
MAYDEGLAQRIRELLIDDPGMDEKRMFGGIAFMINGNMSVGVVKDSLMVRVGPDAYTRALSEPGAREMDFTGKPLKGFVYVEASALDSDEQLEYWVDRGRTFASGLPAK